jgi:LysR family transcriptional regulator, low CO2-responsive transcriptional regulator
MVNDSRFRLISSTPADALPLESDANAFALLPSQRLVDGLTLNQLKVFETVARYGSFTQAAKELYLSQPTISSQIKQLTKVVGMPLFEQTGRTVMLTEVGRKLLLTYQEVFEQLAQFQHQVQALQQVKQGHLKIAAISPINSFITRLLHPFYHQYPGTRISVEILNSQQILQQLSNNAADLYLMSQPPAQPGLHSRPFLKNPLVVVAPIAHPLAAQRRIPIAALNGENLIMREVGSATRHAVQSLLDAHQVKVKVRLEVGNNEAIKQMVRHGLGISVLSYPMVAAEVEKGQLAVLDVAGFPIERSWYTVYPASKQLPIIATTFLEFLEREANTLPVLAA